MTRVPGIKISVSERGREEEEEKEKVEGEGKTVYLEEGYELVGTDERELAKTLSNNIPCSLLLALAVLEEQGEDGGEVGLEDRGSCACCGLSHDDLWKKLKNKAKETKLKLEHPVPSLPLLLPFRPYLA